MTTQDWLPRTRTMVGLLRDLMWLIGVGVPFLAVVVFGAYSWFKDDIIAAARSDLGISDLSVQIDGLAKYVDIEDLQSSLTTIAQSIADNQRRIQILSAPANVVIYGDASRAAGPCSLETGCDIELEVARAPGAEGCRLLSDLTRHSIISLGDRRNRPPVVEAQEPRDIGPFSEIVTLRITPQRGTPLGPGIYTLTTSYTQCPWQIDGVPTVSQVSRRIEINVTA